MTSMLASLYKKIVLLSPYVEVLLRQMYWKNVSRLRKYRPYGKVKMVSFSRDYVDFDRVIDYLRSKGIGEGALLVVHSSYDALECTGLTPEEIIDKLLLLIGKTGTLAMPAIRKFKGEPKPEKILSFNTDDLICTYNVKKTVLISGLLPYTLMRKENAEISHFPLNPMVAVGPLAKEMMAGNLKGTYPSPHGANSSWKFCHDHDAFVIGLGVDLEHYNTMIHVAEEAFGDWKWPVDKWYRLRQFDIVDEQNNRSSVTVSERKPKWGMLHIAELNLYRDLIRHKIIEKVKIEDMIPVSVERSQDLITFLRTRNNKGYPYFGK